jgi:pyruvate/2-oxoglutarate/acetoin dehydrogenase E1 component
VTEQDGTQLEYRAAIAEAMAEELARDDRVVFYGEDVAAAGGVFKATPGLHDRFGDERVFDTPISELAMCGAAFGAAVTGLRPVVEVMFGDFMTLAMDSLVNQAAKWWYLSNERVSVPLVIRSAVGAGGSFGAIHSQNPAAWFLSVPGLKIVCPAFPSDAKLLLKSAIRDDNPVLFLEHKRLYSMKEQAVGGATSDRDEVEALGRARIVREGSDVTIAAIHRGVHDALAAAEELAADGIDAEVMDLRCLRPLDLDALLASVSKTNRLLCVDEGAAYGGWGGSVLGAVGEHGLEQLDDLWLLATPGYPVPYSPQLEQAYLPSGDAIAASVRERAGLPVSVSA